MECHVENLNAGFPSVGFAAEKDAASAQAAAVDCQHLKQAAAAAAAASASAAGPMFPQLGRWIHFHILTFLDGQSVARFSAVCHEARFVTMNGRIRGLSLWEMLRAKEFPLARSLVAANHNKLPYQVLWSARRDAAPSALRRLDFFGRWQGSSCIYNARVTLLPGRSGFDLWRGSHEVDGPFCVDSKCHTVRSEALDAAYCFRPDLRAQWVYEQIYRKNGAREFWGDTDPRLPPVDKCPMTDMESADFTASAKALLRRGKTWKQRTPLWGGSPAPTDGRVAIAGVIQWYMSGQNESELSRGILQASDGRRTGREYVSGVYLPQQRRVVLQGSHKNVAGANVIGLDRYDLFVSEDGLLMRGLTRGYDWLGLGGCWTSTFHGVAAAFASSGVLHRALDVGDPARAPLAATGTLGEIDRWIKGLDDNGALEPSASADPESAALGHENVVDVEFNFESVGFEPNQEDGSVD